MFRYFILQFIRLCLLLLRCSSINLLIAGSELMLHFHLTDERSDFVASTRNFIKLEMPYALEL